MLDEELESDEWDHNLKHRERLFVLHYCTDEEAFLNATESYRRSYRKKDRTTGEIIYPTDESCQSSGSRLIAKDYIKTAIFRLLKLTQNEVDDKAVYELLHDVLLYATYNPADIINADGTLRCKNLKELGELAKCVVDIIPGKNGLHIKLADRSKYITQYLQYLDIIREAAPKDERLNVIEMVSKSINPEEWNSYAEKSEERTS